MRSRMSALVRTLRAACALPLCLAACAAAQGKPSPAPHGEYLLYIGTYTGPKSEGIYRCNFDTRTGKATAPVLAAKTESPSFLALHPNGELLYAVNELAGPPPSGGAMSAFRVAKGDGTLEFLNKQSTEGAHPCHLAIDRTGKWALAANYSSGSVALLPVADDGSLGALKKLLVHKGSSVNQARQKEPHAHCVTLDAENRFALVADLGIDRVVVYRFDAKNGALESSPPDAVPLKPGSGPRHLAFTPDERFAYVLSELTLAVTAFSYAPEKGALVEIETVSTLPAEVAPGYSAAEIVVHPSGKFLYASNRGHDSIAAFAIDTATGKLRSIGHTPTGGKTPRNFALDPTGTFLLAANQDSNSIVVFRIDQETGRLALTGEVITAPVPVCVLFVAPRP